MTEKQVWLKLAEIVDYQLSMGRLDNFLCLKLNQMKYNGDISEDLCKHLWSIITEHMDGRCVALNQYLEMTLPDTSFSMIDVDELRVLIALMLAEMGK